MKKVLLALLIIIVVVGTTTLPAKTKVRAYYSGDAIIYNDVVVTGSANSESLEVFKLEGQKLVKFVDIKPYNSRFGTYDSFFDLKFNQEDGRLYVYAISGYSLYKYDISDLSSPSLVKISTNSYWEWYSRVDKFGNDIVTISARGVKVFNRNMDIVDSYDIKNDIPYNISSGGSSQYIFNITKDQINVFDRSARKVTKNINVDYRSASGNRSLYFDSYDQMIYVVDDYSAKKFDLNGALKSTFDHSGNPGYDVASSNNEYIYFSNGLGVVKLEKSNTKLLASQVTGGIAGTEGWAMGLKVVANSTGDKVVVFNNSSILVLNDKLNKLAYARAGEDTRPEVKENLFLHLNTVAAPTNSVINLTGGGYYPNEKLTVTVKDTKVTAQADENGRFKQTLVAPAVSNQAFNTASAVTMASAGTSSAVTARERTDIKVVGEQSKFNYSISLEVVTTK
ncbi:hypothetical protein COX68_03765 [Candidatus Falkowbacteria bacterium CG_4_10_14_0_2_um_filter_41_15]|uniref:Uncharacterized protein n=1 Tax=Candidatus Falkowbacteria bacterium CG_4_10_14_0_2_um_filter_41_15 TaxID=1974554 RepID=A0A2M7VX24_9BACT|nr:MAG: hypothetical protein COX68_03765 [Candidatus Falkowbacteria bacterium CG_4_10_14_0_2_um_filter_41_15]